MNIFNFIKCKLGFHKPYSMNNCTVCLNCFKDIRHDGYKWIVLKSYHDIRNEQLIEYYDKVKYAFSPEVEYNDDLTKQELDKIFSFREENKYDYISEYERELFEKIFLVHFLEDLEKAKIIKVLR